MGAAQRAATIMKTMPDRRLSVAPMMTHTDRHFRYLLRLISRRVMLYTEMIPTGALLHGPAQARLQFDPAEHPLGIQLGGADPLQLAACARMAEDAGFDEVNLNLGCPSDRVSSARFGACLMAEPGRVAVAVAAMREAVRIPVTVKTRIGIDDRDSFEHLAGFIETVAHAGCGTFILHARKAWLQGLSPRQNRTVPPLRYDLVHRVKAAFPRLEIIINGGIQSLEEAGTQLGHVDGAMIGRAVCRDPYLLAEADRVIFGTPTTPPARHDVLEHFLDYAERQLGAGVALSRLTRHMLGLFHGQPGSRSFRRHLSESACRRGSGITVIRQALTLTRAA